MNEMIQQIIHTWTNGGWVMAALASVALVTYASAARLLFSLRHRRLARMTESELTQCLDKPHLAPAHLGELIRFAHTEVRSLPDVIRRFRQIKTAQLPETDRRLAFLNIMVVSAPLFGLLGTVLGMLLTFKAIGVGGSSTSDIIAKGISEALIATQTGMTVAIPGLFLAFVAKCWRNDYAAFLARLESAALRHCQAFLDPQPTALSEQLALNPSSAPALARDETEPASTVTLSNPLPA